MGRLHVHKLRLRKTMIMYQVSLIGRSEIGWHGLALPMPGQCVDPVNMRRRVCRHDILEGLVLLGNMRPGLGKLSQHTA